MVYVEKPVIFAQNTRNFGRTVVKLFCRISCIAIYEGDGIKIAEVALALRLGLRGLAGAGAQAQRKCHYADEREAPLH